MDENDLAERKLSHGGEWGEISRAVTNSEQSEGM